MPHPHPDLVARQAALSPLLGMGKELKLNWQEMEQEEGAGGTGSVKDGREKWWPRAAAGLSAPFPLLLPLFCYEPRDWGGEASRPAERWGLPPRLRQPRQSVSKLMLAHHDSPLSSPCGRWRLSASIVGAEKTSKGDWLGQACHARERASFFLGGGGN